VTSRKKRRPYWNYVMLSRLEGHLIIARLNIGLRSVKHFSSQIIFLVLFVNND